LWLYYVDSMMHIQAAFQIFKELLNSRKTHPIQVVEDFIKVDNEPSTSSESTNTNFIKNKVSDLQYQVIIHNIKF